MRGDARTILIVDDEADFRFLLRRALQAAGHEVVGEAAHAEEAVRRVEHTVPDIVLFDLHLPGLTDEEFVRALLARAAGSMLVALSSRPAEVHADRIVGLGAFAFYEKSGDLARVADRLERDWSAFQRALAGDEVVAPSALHRRRPEAAGSR